MSLKMNVIISMLGVMIIEVYSTLECNSGECVFDCTNRDCQEIICTDTANSCTIYCGDSDCYGSEFYLAATVNKVICDGNDACKLANFYCGIPSTIPIGYSEQHFDAHIEQCIFILNDNAMSDNGLISCVHNIDYCSVQTKSNNDDFKESIFKCDLTPNDAKCVLKCHNRKSCGSQTSQFLCNAPKCQCNNCDRYLGNTQISLRAQTSTQTPSQTPSISPTNNPTTVPSISPTNSPNRNYFTTNHLTNAPSTAPIIQPTQRNNILIAVLPTNIRRNDKPIILSTLIDDTNDIKTQEYASQNTPLRTSPMLRKIALTIFCVLTLCCSFLGVLRSKLTKQYKIDEKQEPLLKYGYNKNPKLSTIDLTAIEGGVEISHSRTGEFDDNTSYIDSSETSDEETVFGSVECQPCNITYAGADQYIQSMIAAQSNKKKDGFEEICPNPFGFDEVSLSNDGDYDSTSDGMYSVYQNTDTQFKQNDEGNESISLPESVTSVIVYN